jgi:type IV secretory pathway VirB10-like protein
MTLALMLPFSAMDMDGVLARIGFAVVAVLLLVLTATCGLIRPHRPDQQPPSEAAAPAPQPVAVAESGAPPLPQPPANEPATQKPAQPVPPPASAPPEKPTPPPTAKRPAARPQPAQPATAATPAQPARKSAAPGAKAPAPAAPLDLNRLKQELKETRAIGVFSKLTLKNQMDDLLAAVRKFHQGKAKVTLADLHRSYELLVMKVLSLVQDDDQKLASDIVSSREAIWGVLADPKKFAALQL